MVVRLLTLVALLVAGSAWAQDTPLPPTATHVVCDSGCGSPPASADRTAFVAGTTNVSLIGAAFNDALADLASGTYAAPRLTTKRELHVNLRSGGAEIGTVAVPLNVAVAALPAGSNVIGHVIVDSAGVLHVIIDSSAALTVTATLAAETTKVIGTVNVASGQAIQANAGTNLNTSLLALDTTVAKDASLTTLATAVGSVQAVASAAAPSKVDVVGGIDGANLARSLLVTAQGVLYVQPLASFAATLPSALLPLCNAVRKLNCR